MEISHTSTLEDILNLKKPQIESYLRSINCKVTGTILELAQRAHYEATCRARSCNDTVNAESSDSLPVNQIDSTSESSAPPYTDLTSGWTSNLDNLPKINHKNVEHYLISSSHRTDDSEKMACYRQFIRGYNFFKENYVHNVMVNVINEDHPLCYVRSKCFASMKNEVYIQWILITKALPFAVIKASCSCPAGLGEGCTHIAGLLFSLEDATSENNHDRGDVACTSKPCIWNKPKKRALKCKTVDQITFKKIRYDTPERPKTNDTKKITLKNKERSFCEQICDKLKSNRAVIFDLIDSGKEQTDEEISGDLNVASSEEVSTSETVTYESDQYINIRDLIVKSGLDSDKFSSCMSDVPQFTIQELEQRTRGQSENPLWIQARKCRITASIFHDVRTRKDCTEPHKLVERVVGDTSVDSVTSKPLQWGRLHEPIAKKRYKAFKRLHHKQKVEVCDSGLFLYDKCAYLGASPDGIVKHLQDEYLLEVKCPYKWRNSTIADACKSNDFCCYLDENQSLQLKTSHRYYTQIQGQLAIGKYNRCELVIYTLKDLKTVLVEFDKEFWELLVLKLQNFYMKYVIPSIM